LKISVILSFGSVQLTNGHNEQVEMEWRVLVAFDLGTVHIDGLVVY